MPVEQYRLMMLPLMVLNTSLLLAAVAVVLIIALEAEVVAGIVLLQVLLLLIIHLTQLLSGLVALVEITQLRELMAGTQSSHL
tara:strand:+ start:443 stop:691 length:249 start_codon:yes stop_codon:yes gene_type:complete